MHPIARIIDRTFASAIILLLFTASACIEEDDLESDLRAVPGEDGTDETDETEPQGDPDPDPDPEDEGEEEGGEQPECPRDPGPSPASSTDTIRLPLHEPGRSRKAVPEPECP